MAQVLIPANETKVRVDNERYVALYKAFVDERKLAPANVASADDELDRQVRAEACRLGLIASPDPSNTAHKRIFALGNKSTVSKAPNNANKELPLWVVKTVWSLFQVDLRENPIEPLLLDVQCNRRLFSFDDPQMQLISNHPDKAGRESYRLKLTHLKMEDVSGYLKVGQTRYKAFWRIGRCDLHVEADGSQIADPLVRLPDQAERGQAFDSELVLDGLPKQGLVNPVTGRAIGPDATGVSWTLTTTKQVTASAVLHGVHLCDVAIKPDVPLVLQVAFGPDSFQLQLSREGGPSNETVEDSARRQLFAQVVRSLPGQWLTNRGTDEEINTARLASSLKQAYLTKTVLRAPLLIP